MFVYVLLLCLEFEFSGIKGLYVIFGNCLSGLLADVLVSVVFAVCWSIVKPLENRTIILKAKKVSQVFFY